MTEPYEFEKIGEIEFMPTTFQTEPTTFIFQVFRLADGSYQALIRKHPANANISIPDRCYSLGEMIVLMRIFKHGKIISNDLPEKIMERANREAILLKLE